MILNDCDIPLVWVLYVWLRVKYGAGVVQYDLVCVIFWLHAVVTAHLLVTVGALVDYVLASIHAERNQTTSNPATEIINNDKI